MACAEVRDNLVESWGFPGGSGSKNPPAKAGDAGLIPDLGGSHVPWTDEACVPRLQGLCSGAWEPQLQKPEHTRACALQQQRPPQ